jgi:L-ornithine Nalpha-acyltransferase
MCAQQLGTLAEMSSSQSDSLFGAPLVRDLWTVRLAEPDDMPALMRLRARAFRGNEGADDSDDYDADSLHLWIGGSDGAPAATLRLRRHDSPESLLAGYAARFYDLRTMAATRGISLELGRLCTDQGKSDMMMRLVWTGVARLVLRTGAARLIGCTSFHTTDPAPLAPAWALLKARHLGPPEMAPGRLAPEIVGFETIDAEPEPGALALLPPLLRAYLAMGGWVSDHLVIDRDLGTCHVFTCVDIANMPDARKRGFVRMAEG